MKKMIFVIPLLALLGWAKPSYAVSVSGYFDMEYYDADNHTNPYYDQHHLNVMLSHEVGMYRFFSEIEFEQAPDIDYGREKQPAPTDGQGRLFVERAYGQALISKYFNLTMGQMLHPSLYFTNHYPSVINNISGPMMTTEHHYVFTRNIKGVMANGEVVAGLYYNVWTGRGPSEPVPQYESGIDTGYSVGYQGKFNKLAVDVAYKAGDYTEDNLNHRKASSGVDLNLTWGHFNLWSEFATSKHDSDAKLDQTANYITASYAVDLGDKGEIIPFILMDSYKNDYYTSEKKTMAYGVAFKPEPSVTIKAEYKKTDSYNGGADTVDGGGAFAAGNQYALAFVYFYN
jgi:hypothetical protein